MSALIKNGQKLGKSVVDYRAVSYCRVSTEEQARQGVSLEAQRERIAAHCGLRGWRIVGEFADEVSGRKTSNRPGLESALRLVCEQKATLTVYSLSRLARSTRDAIVIAERLERAGAQLCMIVDQIDTSSASGRFFFAVAAAMATLESDLISERTRLALAHLKRKGQRYSGNAPYGFKFEDGRVVPEDAEQSVIRSACSFRVRGMSHRAIATSLRDAGIVNRCGEPFPHQHVGRILRQVDLAVGGKADADPREIVGGVGCQMRHRKGSGL